MVKPNDTVRTKSAKTPAFAARAERAFGRVSKNVIAQHRALNMPVVVWEDGKVVKKRL
jgi:acyl dehydratase